MAKTKANATTSQTFVELLAEAESHTQLLLLRSTLRNLEYWGKRTATDMHEADDALRVASESDESDNKIALLQYRADRALTQLTTLRKMFRAVSEEIAELEVKQATDKAERDRQNRESLGIY